MHFFTLLVKKGYLSVCSSLSLYLYWPYIAGYSYYSFSFKPASLYSHHSRLLMRCLTLILGSGAHSVSLIVFSLPSKSLKVFFAPLFLNQIPRYTLHTHQPRALETQRQRLHVPIQTHTAIHKSASNPQPIRHTDTPRPLPPFAQNKRKIRGSTHSTRMEF